MEEISQRFGLREGFGAVIVEVIKETPAAAAGLRNRRPGGRLPRPPGGRHPEPAARDRAPTSVGESVRLTVLRTRGGPAAGAGQGGRDAGRGGRRARGRRVRLPGPRSGGPARAGRRPGPAGAPTVAGACPRSRADAAGLQVGDVLVAIDGRPVDSLTARARGAPRDARARGAAVRWSSSATGSASVVSLRPDPQRALTRRPTSRDDRPRHHRDALRDRGRPARRARHRLRLRRALQPAQERRGLSAARDRRASCASSGSRPARSTWWPSPAPARLAREWLNRVLHDEAYAKEYYGVRGRRAAGPSGRRVRKWGARFGLVDAVARASSASPSASGSAGHRASGRRARPDRVPRPPHLPRRRRLLGLGLRGPRGAGAHQRQLRRRALRDRLHRPGARRSSGTRPRPSAPGSLGSFYSFVTLALGMKFGEHEYKVMGMAPYAPDTHAARGGSGPARGLRPRGGPARALPLAHAGASATRSSCEPLVGPALRRGRGRRAAPARGRRCCAGAG